MIAFICTMVEAPDDQVFMIDLYHKYKRLMLRTAKKYVADDYACEDIIQDSLNGASPRIIKRILL